jgi:predicted nucleic acid-binding protein
VILVDTSVVVDLMRGLDAKLAALIPTISLTVCGVTRAEVLGGGRDPTHRRMMLNLLQTFSCVPISEQSWDEVGVNLAKLRWNGLTIPIADVVIATVGMELDVAVWARDRHFPLMAKVLPKLRLFVEPP